MVIREYRQDHLFSKEIEQLKKDVFPLGCFSSKELILLYFMVIGADDILKIAVVFFENLIAKGNDIGLDPCLCHIQVKYIHHYFWFILFHS